MILLHQFQKPVGAHSPPRLETSMSKFVATDLVMATDHALARLSNLPWFVVISGAAGTVVNSDLVPNSLFRTKVFLIRAHISDSISLDDSSYNPCLFLA